MNLLKKESELMNQLSQDISSNMKLAQRFIIQLDKYKLAHQLTNSQLADKLQVGRGTVKGWLDGTNHPRIDTLDKISQLANVSYDFFIKSPFMDSSKYLDITNHINFAYCEKPLPQDLNNFLNQLLPDIIRTWNKINDKNKKD